MFIALFITALLVILNGIFSGTEMALVTLRENQLRKLEQESPTGKVVADLARNPNRFLATIQIGITLAGFLASAVAATTISEPVGNFTSSIIPALEGPIKLLSLIVVTLTLSYFTLVFGELAPKRVAMKNPEKWAMRTGKPLALLTKVFNPAVKLLSSSTDAVMKMFGVPPGEIQEELNPQELRDIIISHQAITEQQRQIMRGAFEVTERRVGKVSTPRNEIVYLTANTTCKQAQQLLTETEFSRVPVTLTDDIDDVVGMVHLRDILTAKPATKLETIVRTLPLYPESSLVLPIMHIMQTERINMAMVIDEYGTVTGLITLEDLVEEIVGEIYDDYDKTHRRSYTNKQGELVIPGTFPLYDLPELGVSLPDGPYSTIAGYVIHRLGHLPKNTGDAISYEKQKFIVDGVDGRRITQIKVLPDLPPPRLQSPTEQNESESNS